MRFAADGCIIGSTPGHRQAQATTVMMRSMEWEAGTDSSIDDPALQLRFVPADPDLSGAVRRRAQSLWGLPPDVIVTAPGRIEIVGNHVDYNGGEVVAAAIDRWVVLAARRRDDEVVSVTVSDIGAGSASFPLARACTFDSRKGSAPREWSDYAQASVAALCAAGVACTGVDIYYRGTIPLGVGLSSSSALLVAAVAGIAHVSGAELSKLEIARIAQDAEHRTGAPVGMLDQVSSVAGGILRFSNDPSRVRLLSAQLGDAIFAVCDSGVRHTIPGSRYPQRVAECQQALALLRGAGFEITTLAELAYHDLERALSLLPAPLNARVQHVVEEVERTARAEAAIEAGDRELLGELMNASGRSSAELYDISHPAVERLVADARATPGVYGARMMGGGDGGAAIVLVDRGSLERLQARLPGTLVTICRIARGMAVSAAR
jgi:galactokinase